MSLLLVFCLVLQLWQEKEMSLSTRATIEPSRILAKISSQLATIAFLSIIWKKISWLKGELLVQYQEGAEGVQAEAYASQLDMLKDQKAIGVFAKSLQEGENHFPEEDKFGYQATFSRLHQSNKQS